jgi:hypothetical protein
MWILSIVMLTSATIGDVRTKQVEQYFDNESSCRLAMDAFYEKNVNRNFIVACKRK